MLQPDLFVVPGRETQSLRAWTDVTALLLVIEIVSPSTAHYDHQLKRLRYQRAGVPEYWIVDLQHERIEVLTEPDEDEYQQRTTLRRGDVLRPAHLPGVAMAVADILR